MDCTARIFMATYGTGHRNNLILRTMADRNGLRHRDRKQAGTTRPGPARLRQAARPKHPRRACRTRRSTRGAGCNVSRGHVRSVRDASPDMRGMNHAARRPATAYAPQHLTMAASVPPGRAHAGSLLSSSWRIASVSMSISRRTRLGMKRAVGVTRCRGSPLVAYSGSTRTRRGSGALARATPPA